MQDLEEVWSGSPAEYSGLRVFVCPAYPHVTNGKLEPRAGKYIFLGYANGVKSDRLLRTDGKSLIIFISRDIMFNKIALLKPTHEETSDAGKDHGVTKQVELDAEVPKASNEVVPKQEVQDSDNTALRQQDYMLTRDRVRRQDQTTLEIWLC